MAQEANNTTGQGHAEETVKKAGTERTIDIMQNHELMTHLRNLGLNQYEAQAYLALALGGANTAGEISSTGKIARPRVYDVLAKLQEKGFVAIKSGRPVKYMSMPIGEAVKTLKKYKENSLLDEMQKIEDIGALLHGEMEKTNSSQRYGIEENVWTLKGRNAIYSRLADMVSRSNQNVIVNAPPENLVRKVKENMAHFEAAKQRGAKIQFISSISRISDKRHALHSPNSPIRKLAASITDKHVPTRMVLADSEALLFLTEPQTPAEDEVALWVNSPHLVSTLKANLAQE